MNADQHDLFCTQAITVPGVGVSSFDIWTHNKKKDMKSISKWKTHDDEVCVFKIQFYC